MRVPIAIINVDPTTPINRWKLPVAEDLPISKVLSMWASIPVLSAIE
jgi:hypothetical protein